MIGAIGYRIFIHLWKRYNETINIKHRLNNDSVADIELEANNNDTVCTTQKYALAANIRRLIHYDDCNCKIC